MAESDGFTGGEVKWETVRVRGAKPTERYGHSMVVVPDGCGVSSSNRVLLFGGKHLSGGTEGDIEVWSIRIPNAASAPPQGQSVGVGGSIADTASAVAAWERVHCAGEAPSHRWGHTATFCPAPSSEGGESSPGYVLVMSGFNSTFNFGDCFTLGIPSLSWKSIESVMGDCPPPRAYHTAVYWRGTVVVFGGMMCVGGPYTFYDDVWSFDCSRQRWLRIPIRGITPSPRSQHSAVVSGGEMFVFGGANATGTICDLYALNLVTHQWRRFAYGSEPFVPRPRRITPQPFRVVAVRTSAVSSAGLLVVVGSTVDSPETLSLIYVPLSAAQSTPPSSSPSRTFSTRSRVARVDGASPPASVSGSACLLGFRRLVVFGGTTSDNELRVVDLLPLHSALPPPSLPALSRDMVALLGSRSFSDLTVIVGGQRFPAHRCILSARVPYFRALLQSGFAETNATEVDLTSLASSSEAFAVVLQCIYGGSDSLQDALAAADSVEFCASVLATANALGMDDAVAHCDHFLASRVDQESPTRLLELVEPFEVPRLRRLCEALSSDQQQAASAPEESSAPQPMTDA